MKSFKSRVKLPISSKVSLFSESCRFLSSQIVQKNGTQLLLSSLRYLRRNSNIS